jgi:hypothetical protein
VTPLAAIEKKRPRKILSAETRPEPHLNDWERAWESSRLIDLQAPAHPDPAPKQASRLQLVGALLFVLSLLIDVAGLVLVRLSLTAIFCGNGIVSLIGAMFGGTGGTWF